MNESMTLANLEASEQQLQTVLSAAIRRVELVQNTLGGQPAGDTLFRAQLAAETDNPLRVVIVGEFNTGKSTLVNALIKASVLPMGIIPTTATLNEITYSEQPGVQVVEKDGTLTLLPFEDGVLKQFTARYGEQVHIDFVRILSPNISKQMVFYDTPGVNDVNESRAELVYRLIPESDLVLFVMDVQQAMKRSEEMFLRHRLLSDSLSKVVFILNHCDRASDIELNTVVTTIQTRLRAIYSEVAREMEEQGATVVARQIERASAQIIVIPVSARQELRRDYEASQLLSVGFETLQTVLRQHASQGENKRLRRGKLVIQTAQALNVVEAHIRDVRSLSTGIKDHFRTLSDRLSGEMKELCRVAEQVTAIRQALQDRIDKPLAVAVERIRVEAAARYTQGQEATIQAYVQSKLQRVVEAEIAEVNASLKRLDEVVWRVDVASSDIMGPIPDITHVSTDDDKLGKMLNDPLNHMIAIIAAPIVIFSLGWIGILGLIAAPFARGAWTQAQQQRQFAEQVGAALVSARREISTKLENLISLTCEKVLDHACGPVDRTEHALRLVLGDDERLSLAVLDQLEAEVRTAKDELMAAYTIVARG